MKPPGERRGVLSSETAGGTPGGDGELQAEVRKLQSEAQEQTPDSSGEINPEIESILACLKPEAKGERIGHYTLLEEIGEGGFAIVWQAEQVEPIRRRVALKIMKVGMDTREFIGRFEQERQALAMLEHRNIAKVFDAGATQFGRPYFAMEYVNGSSITRFCDEQRLGVHARLELFLEVCSAINHAHQKGIIHRDLKPSNVMVALDGEKPAVKVIDFGIAKAIQGRITDRTLVVTRAEQFIGTPAYMSPEQVSGEGMDIDTRSDIYSLGVLLYELLTGSPPFESHELTAAGYEEMRRIIREVEPPKPSRRLRTAAAKDGAALAAARGIAPEKLGRVLEPDLDWIVMKAIEKERGRRYETAYGLARDIGRFLRDEPIHARPPSRSYQFQRFVRRYKVWFAAAVTVVVALLLGIVASTWQAVRATRAEREQSRLRVEAELEKRRAQLEALKSQQVAKFLGEIFNRANPYAGDAADRTLMKEILDQANTRLKTDLAGQPEVQAELQIVMGLAYNVCGESQTAMRLLRDALATLRSVGNENLALAKAMESLASVLQGLGAIVEAESLFRECLALKRRLFLGDHDEVAATLRNLASAVGINGKAMEGEELIRESLAMYQRLHGDEHAMVADSQWALASNLRIQGRLVEAENLIHQAVAMLERVGELESNRMCCMLDQTARIQVQRGNPEAALAVQQKSLAMSEKLMGKRHPWARESRRFNIELLHRLGKYRELEAILRKEVAFAEALDSREHGALGKALYSLADVLRKRGKLVEALWIAERAVSLYETNTNWSEAERRAASRIHSEVVGDLRELSELAALHRKYLEKISVSRPIDNSKLAVAHASLARTLLAAERFKEAETSARECLAIYAKQATGDWRRFDAQSILGGSLVGQKKHSEALTLLLPAYEGLNANLDKIPPDERVRLTEAHQRIVQAYEHREQLESLGHRDFTLPSPPAAGGNPGEKIQRAKEKLELHRYALGKDHPNTLSELAKLAGLYYASGLKNDALKVCEELLPLQRQKLGAGHPDAIQTLNRLAHSYLEFGLVDNARLLLADSHVAKVPYSYQKLFLVLIYLWRGQESDYEDACKGMLEWAAHSSDHEALERIVKVFCARQWDDEVTKSAALAVAKRAVELGKGNNAFLAWANMALGMAEYRAGNYAASDKALNASIGSGKIGGMVATCSFYRVMCLSRQKLDNEARKVFADAENGMKKLPVDEKQMWEKGTVTIDDLICWMAYKEARAMLNTSPDKER